MIYWQGKRYALRQGQYNGKILGYLCDGLLVASIPKTMVAKGYISTDEGVIILLCRNRRYLLLGLLIVITLLVFACWPRYHSVYYQVTFAEQPLLNGGVLYCNVANESDITVSVQFVSSTHKTAPYSLDPGEFLPHIAIDFVPDLIRYNGTSDFLLEVRCD